MEALRQPHFSIEKMFSTRRLCKSTHCGASCGVSNVLHSRDCYVPDNSKGQHLPSPPPPRWPLGLHSIAAPPVGDCTWRLCCGRGEGGWSFAHVDNYWKLGQIYWKYCIVNFVPFFPLSGRGFTWRSCLGGVEALYMSIIIKNLVKFIENTVC